MTARSKICSSFDDAVRDIPDGATLGFGGFAVVGMPINLYQAVANQGATNLTCVSNSTRGGATLPADAPDMGQMIKNGQVRKVICAFTAPTRASQRLILSEYVERGLIEAELVPQGTLAERIRAGGAGLGGVLTTTGLGTLASEGQQVIQLNGQDYLIAPALRADVALVAARSADYAGNLVYSLTARNFNPLMTMAADIVIAETNEIVPLGVLPPDVIHTPGILIDHLIERPLAP